MSAKETIISKIKFLRSSKELTQFLLQLSDISGKSANQILASYKLVCHMYQHKILDIFIKMLGQTCSKALSAALSSGLDAGLVENKAKVGDTEVCAVPEVLPCNFRWKQRGPLRSMQTTDSHER